MAAEPPGQGDQVANRIGSCSLKIVHLVGWYFPDSVGGTEVYVAGLAAQQRERGHQVTVAAPMAGAPSATRYEHHGVEVFRYPIPQRASKLEAQGRVEVRGTQLLRDYFDHLRPDVAHFHSITTGLGLDEMIAAKRAGARVLFTSHLPSTGYICLRGTLMHWGEYMSDGIASPVKCAACALEQRGLPKALATGIASVGTLPGVGLIASSSRAGTAFGMADLVRFRMSQQRTMMQVVDRFVLLNNVSREIAEANGAPREKLALNYLGHSFDSVSPKPSPSEKPTTLPLKIGYVGRLAEGKGLTEFLAAIERLGDDKRIQFEIHGRANDAEGRAIAAKIDAVVKTRENLRLAPPVPPEHVARVMTSFDVLCVPSSSFENGPTVVSEAYAVGTPVIGTKIGAMQEIILDGLAGLLVPPGNSIALADAFRRIADNPALIDNWRENLPRARTMRDVADDYELMYAELTTA